MSSSIASDVLRGSTILVVEDDQSQLDLLCEYMRHAGCSSVVANGPAAAIAAIESDPSIRLAFSDVRMPDKDGGLQFIRQVHQRWPNLPLVVVSANEEDMEELRGTPDYPALLIPKPVRRWQVEDAIKLLLRPTISSYDALPYGVVVFDGFGNFISMNTAAKEAAKANTPDTEDFIATVTMMKEDGSLLPDEERCERQVLATKGAIRGLIHGMVLPDGQRRWFRLEGMPTFSLDGSIDKVVVSAVDVTEQRRSERALRRNDDRFRTILDAAYEGVAVYDAEGCVTYVNQRMCEMNGYSADEMLGRTLAEFTRPEVQANFDKDVASRKKGVGSQGQVPLQRKDGSTMWVMVTSSTLYDDSGGFAGTVSMMTDLSKVKAAEQALTVQALHDNLTGLPNRVLLQDRLQQALASAQRERDTVAFLMMDLDRFKEVNDTLGHHHGDLLLCEVGQRVQGLLRSADTFARLGGDEFAAVLPGAGNTAKATAVAQKILRMLHEPFVLEGKRIEVGASIGIAFYPEHGQDASNLLRQADIAMYIAKRERSGYCLYSPKNDENGSHQLTMTAELRQAIQQNQLELHYQPKVDMRTGQTTSTEALIRWRHPERGLIPPDSFIPLAEQTGLITPISAWVIEEAIRQLNAWNHAGLPLATSVNLTMRDLRDATLPDKIEQLLRSHGVNPERFRIEITESIIMADPQQTMAVVKRLHDIGVAFSIDDFGTGYSSLAYLKELPAREIKIDKSFVLDLARDESDAAIVRSVIDLAHNLGRTTVAEGVETKAIWDTLQVLGCDVAQGYYMGKPMPAKDLEAWLSSSEFGLVKNISSARGGSMLSNETAK